MKFEMFVALRHLKARKRKNIISIITFISVFGIMLGVACLIIVLAVMTGFTGELKEKMLSMNAHINLFPRVSDYYADYESTLKTLDTMDGVVAAGPFLIQKISAR